MTFSLLYNPKEEDRLILHSVFKTEALKGDVKLIMDESLTLSSKTQGTLQWEITPERYLGFLKSLVFPFLYTSQNRYCSIRYL